MSQAVFEILSPAILFDRLPITIHQRTSRTSGLLLLLLLIPAVAAIIVPFGLIASHAAQGPEITSAIWSKPLASLQIFVAMLLWLLLIILPLKSLLGRLGRERSIRISDGRVVVKERQLYWSSSWSAPTGEFLGIAHDVRTTLSTTRHELILVHPNKRQSLLLLTATAIPQRTIDSACHLMKIPQIPARDLYFSASRTFERFIPQAAEPQTADARATVT